MRASTLISDIKMSNDRTTQRKCRRLLQLKDIDAADNDDDQRQMTSAIDATDTRVIGAGRYWRAVGLTRTLDGSVQHLPWN